LGSSSMPINSQWVGSLAHYEGSQQTFPEAHVSWTQVAIKVPTTCMNSCCVHLMHQWLLSKPQAAVVLIGLSHPWLLYHSQALLDQTVGYVVLLRNVSLSADTWQETVTGEGRQRSDGNGTLEVCGQSRAPSTTSQTGSTGDGQTYCCPPIKNTPSHAHLRTAHKSDSAIILLHDRV
jgi:hypothetical protein